MSPNFRVPGGFRPGGFRPGGFRVGGFGPGHHPHMHVGPGFFWGNPFRRRNYYGSPFNPCGCCFAIFFLILFIGIFSSVSYNSGSPVGWIISLIIPIAVIAICIGYMGQRSSTTQAPAPEFAPNPPQPYLGDSSVNTNSVVPQPMNNEVPLNQTTKPPKFCPSCGAEITDNAKFCSYCGNKF